MSVAEETANEAKQVLPFFRTLIPNRSWLGLQISNSSRSTWLKVLLISGSATGAVVLGTYLFRRHRRLQSALSKERVLPVANGEALVGHSGSSPNDKNQIDSGRSEQQARTTRDENCGGLALLLEEDNHANKRPCLEDSLDSVSNRRFNHRKRSDSICSGTTTLLLTTRTPSELLLYGLESLKRAIRLWEESRSRLQVSSSYDVTSEVNEASVDSELEFILSKAKQLVDDVEDYRKEISPDIGSIYEDREDAGSSHGSEQSFGASTTLTLPFYDIEPNIHFFKFYTQAVDNYENILQPRIDRCAQVHCESRVEFTAKVECLRMAFADIMAYEENRSYFAEIGRDVLEIILTHSLKDPAECLSHLDNFVQYVSNVDNHESIETEIAIRKIPCLSFYDLVLDYMIMESFDDLENPPSAVQSVANNRWLSSGFKELALQTAVSAVLRHKRSKLTVPDGFFANFYNISEHITPILAWGYLGNDYDLKFKCNIIKESLIELIRDYFSFDRVRYTSLHDLTHDIMRTTDDAYNELQDKLSVCK